MTKKAPRNRGAFLMLSVETLRATSLQTIGLEVEPQVQGSRPSGVGAGVLAPGGVGELVGVRILFRAIAIELQDVAAAQALHVAPASPEQVGNVLHVHAEADAFATVELVGSLILEVEGVSPRGDGTATHGILATMGAQVLVGLDEVVEVSLVLL